MEGNFLFSSLNPKEKQQIIMAVQLVEMKSGETVIKQGDDGDNFYLIEKGNLDCSRLMNPSDEKDTHLKVY